MLHLTAHARSDRLRELSARLFRLSEMVALPARGHEWADRLIDEGEEIAIAVRREFR